MAKSNLLGWRMLLTRVLNILFYEPGVKKHNYNYVHSKFGIYLTSVELPTFLKYKNDKQDLSGFVIPQWLLVGLLAMRYYRKHKKIDGFDAVLPEELKVLSRKLRKASAPGK